MPWNGTWRTATWAGVMAVGIDEIAWHRGHKYLTLVYDIGGDIKRLLAVAEERTEASLRDCLADVPVALQQASNRLATSRNGLGFRVLKGGRARLSALETLALSICPGTLGTQEGNQISYQPNFLSALQNLVRESGRQDPGSGW